MNGVALSPDGKHLASAGGRDGVKLWDVATGQLVFAFEGQAEIVNAVAFSPDGKRLASAGTTGKVAVWDVAAPIQATNEATLITEPPPDSMMAGIPYLHPCATPFTWLAV